ncbi:MAG: hypothetical protein ABJB65_06140 [Chloroflexota bacterium]
MGTLDLPPLGAHHRQDATECNRPGDRKRVFLSRRFTMPLRLASPVLEHSVERRRNHAKGRSTAVYIGGGIVGLILLILLILWLTGNL